MVLYAFTTQIKIKYNRNRNHLENEDSLEIIFAENKDDRPIAQCFLWSHIDRFINRLACVPAWQADAMKES